MKTFLTRKALLLTFVLLSLYSLPTSALGQQINPSVAQQASSGKSSRPKADKAENWYKTELYFGTAKPDGSFVTEIEFMNFLNAEITPRFPDGLTVLTGYGQFLNSAGIIQKETSYLLIILYPPQAKDASRKIEEIRELYKSRFDQESVLRADNFPWSVSF